ncbi:rhodanese-like domain-containing protein [Tahibacter amnicola]|uniref:Rhodanese domain-containing protein n=1 Tax=Tahibacter amnicola TaxID=2976241 RepID=A0ABY6BLT3_9GAMM|nr:hypothetical protein [Tahibacter amnicola]UXI70591.1 hypothetical protein N4264_13395 [Tahibacter amnicola]
MALAAGSLAAVAGSSRPPLGDSAVSATQLADLIRQRREGLLVLDVRPPGAAAVDRIPGAKALADVDLSALPSGTLVIVLGDPDVDAAFVDGLRRQAGTMRFVQVQGGAAAWRDEVLYPVIRSDASEAQRRRFDERAQRSRYFGGVPQEWDPGTVLTRPRSRRGC